MIEKLGQIATESIDSLIEIKKDRDVLIERLERLDDQKTKVSDIVLERVRSDYEAQKTALAEQAAPLKEIAREQFAKLEELLSTARNAMQATALDREELELRHQVGEFGDGEFTEHRNEIAAQQAQQEQELTEIESVRESFVAAFDSEEDLLAPMHSPPDLEHGEVLSSSLPSNVYDTQETDRKRIEEEAAKALESSPDDEEDDGGAQEVESEDGTVIEPDQDNEQDSGEAESSGDLDQSAGSDGSDGSDGPDTDESPAPDSPDPMQPMPPDALPSGGTVLLSVPPPPPGDVPAIGSTAVLKQARLVPVEPIAGGSEFSIEPVTTIGRTKENSIRVDEPAVSRGHAQISLTNEGYRLRDLGSENGTFVNGERIDTRLLQEGDRIQIGTVRFVFYDTDA